MEKNLSPADVQRWRDVRSHYKNQLVLDKVVDAEGSISPASLRTAAKTQNRKAYMRGKNDFTELSNAGSLLIRKLPDSGTPERIAAKLLKHGVAGSTAGAAAGAGVGALVGAPWAGAVVGTGVGMLAPSIYGRVLMSGQARRWLLNRAAKGDFTAIAMLQGVQSASKLNPPPEPKLSGSKKDDELWRRAMLLDQMQRGHGQ